MSRRCSDAVVRAGTLVSLSESDSVGLVLCTDDRIATVLFSPMRWDGQLLVARALVGELTVLNRRQRLGAEARKVF